MTVQELDNKLNQAILSGKAMEAFEELYAEDVVMQENSGPEFHGKAKNREREMEFFNSVEEFRGATLVSSAVSGDTSFGEWSYDLVFKGGAHVILNQVAVRRWRDGKVAFERFYYSK